MEPLKQYQIALQLYRLSLTVPEGRVRLAREAAAFADSTGVFARTTKDDQIDIDEARALCLAATLGAEQSSLAKDAFDALGGLDRLVSMIWSSRALDELVKQSIGGTTENVRELISRMLEERELVFMGKHRHERPRSQAVFDTPNTVSQKSEVAGRESTVRDFAAAFEKLPLIHSACGNFLVPVARIPDDKHLPGRWWCATCMTEVRVVEPAERSSKTANPPPTSASEQAPVSYSHKTCGKPLRDYHFGDGFRAGLRCDECRVSVALPIPKYVASADAPDLVRSEFHRHLPDGMSDTELEALGKSKQAFKVSEIVTALTTEVLRLRHVVACFESGFGFEPASQAVPVDLATPVTEWTFGAATDQASVPESVPVAAAAQSPHRYLVFWSPREREYVGQCCELRRLSHSASTPEEALAGIKKLVEAVEAEKAS